MSKPVLAVDLDDVLADNAEGFVAFSNERYGTNLKPGDYTENWAVMWKVDLAEAEKRAVEFHDGDAVLRYTSKENAKTVLEKLKDRFKIIVITSRRRVIESHTKAWLQKHYPDTFDAISFAGIFDTPIRAHSFHQTKADLFSDNKVSYVIDDQLKHCLAANEFGIDSILFGDYPWNQMEQLPSSVTRCQDWAAVEKYFDGRS